MNSCRWIAIALACSFTTTAVAADGTVLWQIGTPDNRYGEFANAAAHVDYPKSFGNGVNFTVGSSDPAKDWSAIHPGPADGWAGSKSHACTIRFELSEAPAGRYELVLNLADTHALSPPTLQISLNGATGDYATQPGGGDISLSRPERGKPQVITINFSGTRLKVGANELVIRNISGAWLLYDAVTLRKADTANPTLRLEIKPTIFYVKDGDALKQEFAVNVNGVSADGPVKLAVSSGSAKVAEFELDPPPLGILSTTVLLPAAEHERPLDFTATAGEARATASVTQVAQRKWKIFLAPSVHTDIGYTHVQDEVIRIHNRNTDLSLELAKQYPLYHWNIEVAWGAQMWLRDRSARLHDELLEAARQRRVGIEAGYLNMLTGLCTGEELIRNLYYAARLSREKGVPFESFTLTDAPSHVWSLPSILAGAGLNGVSVGVNQTRAPLFRKNIHHKSPFWWEGPDGQRVMTWFAPGYFQADVIGAKHGMAAMRRAIESQLAWWNSREDYPYDAILLHGAYSDNVAIDRSIAESVTAYSAKYAYPQVILCANNMFFDYMAKNYGDKLAVVRGCGGSWWEDGAGSSALETAVNRNSHQEIIAAEALWGVLAATNADAKVPQEALNTAWDNILLYDEHTWGAWNSITHPQADFVQRQWAIKAGYCAAGSDGAKRLLADGLETLAAMVDAPTGSVMVFNPSGQMRTGVAHARIPAGTMLNGGSKPVRQQVVDKLLTPEVIVAFIAEDVPAVGYRTYKVVPEAEEKKQSSPAATFADGVLENGFYRVEFNPATGAIKSIRDKKLDRELVDAGAPYGFGQLIYAHGGGEKGQAVVECPKVAEVKFLPAGEPRVEGAASGPVFASAKARTKARNFPTIEMEVQLYAGIKRIDLIYRLQKDMTFDKEAVYLAFPFTGKNPQFRYEIGGGSVRPNEDQMPGGCRDWFSVQRWITLKTDEVSVAWSPVDTPLVTLCDMTPGKWLEELPITNGTIYAYTMNNYWFTNYKAGQDGAFTFRYSLTSDEAIDPAKATVFGESVHAPLRTVNVPKRTETETPALPASASFCEVAPANVELTAFKPADDGKGLIVRVRETAGVETQTRIMTHLPRVKKATLCDLVERPQGELTLQSGQIGLKLKPNAMATIRLE